MKTIITKYIGATNCKGSRIGATDGDFRVYVPYDHGIDLEDNHRVAARRLVEEKWKNNRPFRMVAGHTKKGMVWVIAKVGLAGDDARKAWHWVSPTLDYWEEKK